MYTPKVTEFAEVIEFDNQLSELSDRITNIKDAIRIHETKRNEANIIVANDSAYQSQHIADEARRVYRSEGAAIAELTQKLQPLEHHYRDLNLQRGRLYRELYVLEAQKQYEAETVESNQLKNGQLSRSIAELDMKIEKLNNEIAALDKKQLKLDGYQVTYNRWKAEFDSATVELENAEAQSALDNNKARPVEFRERVKKARENLSDVASYLPTDTLLKLIVDNREKLTSEIASIEAEKNLLCDQRNANNSLIAQIISIEKLNDFLSSVVDIYVCDPVLGASYLERLKKGVCLPIEFGTSKTVFDGLLDELDERRSRM